MKDPAPGAAGETIDGAGGTLLATGIEAPGLPPETAAAGGERCRLGVGTAAGGSDGATGIEATSLGGTVDGFAASLAAGTADRGGASMAGALTDSGVIGGAEAGAADDGVAVDLGSGATAR